MNFGSQTKICVCLPALPAATFVLSKAMKNKFDNSSEPNGHLHKTSNHENLQPRHRENLKLHDHENTRHQHLSSAAQTPKNLCAKDEKCGEALAGLG